MNIKEVAKLSGVSVSTVSRVLNNHPYVSEKAKEKVLRVIEETHFVPHTGAIDLVKQQSDAIGVIVRGMGNFFFNEMFYKVETEIVNAGYSIYVEHIHSSEDELEAAGRLAKSKKLKGIILLGGRNSYQKDEIKVLDVPFVCCTFSNCFGDVSKDMYCSVGIDDEKAGYDATKYLIDHGHKDIAIVLSGIHDNSISEIRFGGYVRAMQEANLPIREELIVKTTRYSIDAAYESVKTFLNEDHKYTAIFAISDAMALATMKALNEKGLDVPNDCSVVAIDGLEISKYYIPTLTTFVQPKEKIAVESIRILDAYIKGEKAAHIIEDTVLREGASVKQI